MSTPEILAAGAFALLAVAHSALGETGILRPLFAADWEMVETPRWAAVRILRFAWHLTSVAWIGLAVAALDVPVLVVLGMVGLISAIVIFFMLRGHLAWPIFLVGGLAALHGYEPLPRELLVFGAIATVAVLVGAAAVHVWWACGGTWGLDAALPINPATGQRSEPGRWLVVLVAVQLMIASVLVALVVGGVGPNFLRWLAVALAAVLTLRAIGDTKVAGFTKSIRETRFADADDRLFTPLCVFLALGTTAALLV